MPTRTRGSTVAGIGTMTTQISDRFTFNTTTQRRWERDHERAQFEKAIPTGILWIALDRLFEERIPMPLWLMNWRPTLVRGLGVWLTIYSVDGGGEVESASPHEGWSGISSGWGNTHSTASVSAGSSLRGSPPQQGARVSRAGGTP